MDFTKDYFDQEQKMSGILFVVAGYNVEWATNNNEESNAFLRLSKNDKKAESIIQAYRYDIRSGKQLIVNKNYPVIPDPVLKAIRMTLNMSYKLQNMDQNITLWQLLIYNINNAHKDDENWVSIDMSLPLPDSFKCVKKPGRRKK